MGGLLELVTNIFEKIAIHKFSCYCYDYGVTVHFN